MFFNDEAVRSRTSSFARSQGFVQPQHQSCIPLVSYRISIKQIIKCATIANVLCAQSYRFCQLTLLFTGLTPEAKLVRVVNVPSLTVISFVSTCTSMTSASALPNCRTITFDPISGDQNAARSLVAPGTASPEASMTHPSGNDARATSSSSSRV